MNRRTLFGRTVAALCAPVARYLAPALPPDCQGRRAHDFNNGTCDAARSRSGGDARRRAASPSGFDGLEAAPPAGCESPGSHLIHRDFAPDRRALAASINRGGVTGLHVDADDLSDYAEGGRRGS